MITHIFTSIHKYTASICILHTLYTCKYIFIYLKYIYLCTGILACTLSTHTYIYEYLFHIFVDILFNEIYIFHKLKSYITNVHIYVHIYKYIYKQFIISSIFSEDYYLYFIAVNFSQLACLYNIFGNSWPYLGNW